MRIRRCIPLFLLAAVTSLSGCLAVNMALGAGGLLLGAPVQYAAVAYSVGEYSYQYGVNGKTPVEVMGEKLAFLSPDRKAAPSPDARPDTPRLAATQVKTAPDADRVSSDASVTRKTPISVADAVGSAISSRSRSTPPRPAAVRPKGKTSRPDFPVPDSPRTLQVSTHVPTIPVITALEKHRVPTAVNTTALSRLQRVERRFRTIDHHETEHVLRLLLPERNNGINGGWQIRHALNQQPVSR